MCAVGTAYINTPKTVFTLQSIKINADVTWAIMHLSNTLFASALFAATIAHSTCDISCPAIKGWQGVDVRLPPWKNSEPREASWIDPPVGWYFQPWYLIWSSNTQYKGIRNFESDPNPVDPSQPTGQVDDLASFQVQDNDTVYTMYGLDTPDQQYSGTWHYASTGVLTGAGSTFAILAWGCDAAGKAYYASFSTASESTRTPVSLDIMSLNKNGADLETTQTLLKTLASVQDQEIQQATVALQKIPQDGGRDSMDRITTCDKACKSNADLLPLLSMLKPGSEQGV